MDVSFARVAVRLGLCWFCALTSREANAQLSGLFQSVPDTLSTYTYHTGTFHTIMLPVDLTVSFSDDNPTSALSAVIIKPIIGANADGTPIYPIATQFPMRVSGTSTNGQDFHGDLLGTEYLFDWNIKPATGGDLLLNGRVYWSGGRYELTTISNALLVPALPGDYNRDNTLNSPDYILFRKHEGTTYPLPNDPIGGTIGPDHYTQWRTRFGQTIASAASLGNASASAAPEPATRLIMIAALLTLSAGRRARLTNSFD